jgi:hypothetical protein
LVARLITAVIVFALSMFCGLVMVSTGLLAGRYETLFPYTEKDICTQDEKLVLEKETSTTGGTVVIDGNLYDSGFTAKTLFCINELSGDGREVTDETYAAVENLQKRIGWYATFAFFVVTMSLILIFERPILKRVDKVIGYKPIEGGK